MTTFIHFLSELRFSLINQYFANNSGLFKVSRNFQDKFWTIMYRALLKTPINLSREYLSALKIPLKTQLKKKFIFPTAKMCYRGMKFTVNQGLKYLEKRSMFFCYLCFRASICSILF